MADVLDTVGADSGAAPDPSLEIVIVTSVDDTVLVISVVDDAPPEVILVSVPTDTVVASGEADPAPDVVVVAVFTDTVVADIDYSPGTAGGTALQSNLDATTAALQAQIAASEATTAQDFADARAEAIAAVNAAILLNQQAVADSLVYSRAAIAAVQSAVDLNEAAVAQSLLDSAAAISAVQSSVDANRLAVAQSLDASNTAIAAANLAITQNASSVAAANASAADALNQLMGVATTIYSLQSQVGQNTSSISVQAGALTTATQSLSGQITAVQTQFNGNISTINQSLVSLTNAQSATAASLSTLTSTVAGNTSTITNNYVTLSDATQTVATNLQSFMTTYNGNAAIVQSQISSVSTATTANATSLTSLQATVGMNSANIISDAATAASATQTVATNLSALNTNFNGNVSSVQNQISTLSTAQSTTATMVTGLTSTIGGGSGSSNVIIDPDMVSLLDYVWATNSPGAPTYGLNRAGYFSATMNVYWSYIPNATYGVYVNDLRTSNSACSPGVRYEFSVLAANEGTTSAAVFLEWLDLNGALLSNSQVYLGAIGSGASGNQANFSRLGGFATAPTGAAQMRMNMRHFCAPTGNYAYYAQPILRAASPGQIALSPYTSPGSAATSPYINASIQTTATTAANANAATAATVTQLRSDFNSNSSSVQSSLSTLTTNESSTAASLLSLTSTVSGNTATVTNNYTTLSNATSTVAGNLASFMTTYNGNAASVQNQIATLTTSDQSTATSVSMLTATFGGGGNDLVNSDLNGNDGWIPGIQSPSGSVGFNPAGYFSTTSGVLFASTGATTAGYYVDWNTPIMTAEAGVRYEFSVLAAGQGASTTMQLYVAWINTAGNVLSYTLLQSIVLAGLSQDAGNTADYTRIGGFAAAPSGTTGRQMLLRTQTGNGTNANGFWQHPFTRTATSTQTVLSPYSSGTAATTPYINAAITNTATSAANVNAATAATVTQLRSDFNSNSSSVQSSLDTLTTNQASTAASLLSLTSTVSGNTASIQNNYTTLSNATQTVAGNLASFMTTYNGNAASVQNQIATLTTSTQSTATSVSMLTANFAAGGGSGNLIANSDFNPGYDGWNIYTSVAGDHGLDLPGWFPPSGSPGVLYAHTPGTPASGSVMQWSGPAIPVTAGQRYEISAYAAFHRAARVEFYVVAFSASGTATNNVFLQAGGRSGGSGNGDIANFDQLGGFYTVPAGTSYIGILIQSVADGTSGEPYLFWSRPTIRLANPGQTQLSTYVSGTQANVIAINASITNTATSAANATQSLAATVSQLTSTYNSNASSVQTSLDTLTTNTTSTAASLQTFTSSFGGGVGTGNMIVNSEMIGLDTYSFSTSSGSAQHGIDYNAPGSGTGRYYSYLPTGTYASQINDLVTPWYTAAAGTTYEASVAAENDDGNGNGAILYIEYADGNGNIISTPQWQGASSTYTSGELPASRIGGLTVAPAGTGLVRLLMRQAATPNGQYARFAQPMLRVASPGQTTLSPYQPGTQANVPAINATISNNYVTLSNATQAVAGNLQSFMTQYNGNSASVQNQIATLTTNTSATATQVSSLTTTVNGNSTNISQLFTSVNGLSAQYVLAISTGPGQFGGLVLTGVKQANGTQSTLLEITANVVINGSLLINKSLDQSSLNDTSYGNLVTPHNVTEIDSGSGTYTVPAGVYWIFVQIWGGGAGAVAFCYSGASGAYTEKSIAVTPGQQFNYVVGGGAQPIRGSNSNGPQYSGSSQGGTTTFGNVLTATGGYTGFSGNGNGSTSGGTSSGGTFNRNGSPGQLNFVTGQDGSTGGATTFSSTTAIGGGAFNSSSSAQTGYFPGGGGGNDSNGQYTGGGGLIKISF